MLSGKHLIGKRFVSQHDNDSKHTAGVYADRQTHNGTLSVTDWPPQSVDLNVIEEVWIMLNEALNVQRRAKFAWASLGSVPNIYFQVSLELYRLCLLYYVSK